MMKKLLILSLAVGLVAGAFIALPQASQAKTDLGNYQLWGLTNNSSEERNGCSGYSGWLNDSYRAIWHRYPRCDEIRFQQSHGTTRTRLEAWLQAAKRDKFTKLMDGKLVIAFAGEPFKTQNAVWYIKNGQRHRVYDWPTLMAWGLTAHDSSWLPTAERVFFYRVVPEGQPLQLWAGKYYSDVKKVWEDPDATPTLMPDSVKAEFLADAQAGHGFLKYNQAGIKKCDTWFDRSDYKYYDFSYADTLHQDSRGCCCN